MNIWFVDDRAANRATWRASFPEAVRQASTLRTFASVPDILAAFEVGDWPDVLFVDFYLEAHTGLDVVERVLADTRPTPLLIAHSTLAPANAQLLAAGAHLTLEKRRNMPRTQSIVDTFRTPADVDRLIREHVGHAAP
ncbi:MAG: hypothetical protein AB7T63_03785 [Planctomycetota bacterium]